MPTFPQITSPPQASAEVLLNELGVSMEHVATYAMDPATTSDPGLTWGYRPGRWRGFPITAGTFTLTNNSANYLVVEIATGAHTCSASNTNWNDTLNYVRAYKVTTLSGVVSATEDHRDGLFGGGAGVGGAAGSAGYEFLASNTTTDSDPGTGTLRWNNGTQASATILYIDNVDGDSTSLAVLWASLTAGSLLTVTDAADANVWQLWKVNAAPINGTGYYKFPVTLQAQEGGNIANTSSILLGVDGAAAPLADGDKGDVVVSSSGTVWTLDSAVTPLGVHAVPVVAGAMRPSASGGCAALALIATTANQPDISSLDFDEATEEYAQFLVPMPKSWNEGTITAKFVWSHPATVTNFAVVWALQAVATSDGDAVAAAFGTAQTVTDTGGTTNAQYVSAATSAITIGGSPVADDIVHFRAYRKAADGSDTLAVDARLHAVVLFITTDAGNDA